MVIMSAAPQPPANPEAADRGPVRPPVYPAVCCAVVFSGPKIRGAKTIDEARTYNNGYLPTLVDLYKVPDCLRTSAA
jgi:hypothetical protein